jgi:hypoxanthine phosphoribosyltransferase
MKITPYITQERIAQVVSTLASQIEYYYRERERELVIIVVYNGAMFFASDLLKQVNLHCEIVGVQASSYYGNTSSSGSVACKNNIDVNNKHVLIIDDIYDTGLTLNEICKDLLDKGAITVEMCVLLNKQIKKTVDLDVLFVGINIPNIFVYGYGLDVNNRFRNLNYIAVYESESTNSISS